MRGYQELAEKIVFNFNDALTIFKHAPTAYGALKRLSNKGIIKKVRNNLYVSINPVTHLPYASKYQIGSSLNDDAYIGYLTALEYYGYLNQVNQVCYVVSSSRFNTFEFDGITYKHKKLLTTKGVNKPMYTEKIRVTEKEKTIIDCIYDIGTNIGLEELTYSLDMITSLDESKLLQYLDDYSIQSLYQRAGYLLFLFNDRLNLSESFFSYIRSKIGKNVSYLSEEAKQDGVFNKNYQLVVPKWLNDKGVDDEI